MPENSLDEQEDEVPGASRPDPVTRVLLVAVGAVLVAVLALLGFLVYSATTPRAPRTRAELQIQTLLGVTKSNPKDATSWALLVAAYTGAGKYDEARDTLDDATRALGSEPAVLAVEAGRLLYAEGNLDASIPALQKAAAKAQEERKAKVEALKKKNVIEKIPSESLADAEVLLGEVYLKQARYADAVAALTAALGEDPTMADVLVDRGRAYAADGKTAQARADYAKSLSFIPGYGPAQEAMAELKGVSK